MIIACPQCDTRFDVPDDVFGNGERKVRCASCSHVWFQQPDNKGGEDNEDFSELMAQRAEENAKEEEDRPQEKSGFITSLKDDFTKGGKIIAAACVSVLFLFFAYQYFQPKLIAGEGLAFNDMTIKRHENGLTLTGEIVNTVNDKRGVPSLKITPLLADNVEGDVRLIAPEKTILESGEILSLSIALDDIGAEVQNLSVTFEGAQSDSESSEHIEDESHAFSDNTENADGNEAHH